jgi:hypothetical protein
MVINLGFKEDNKLLTFNKYEQITIFCISNYHQFWRGADDLRPLKS